MTSQTGANTISLLSTQDFLQQLGIQDNKSLQGTVTAIYDIGCFFGAIAAYFLGGQKTVSPGTTGKC